MPPTIIVGGIAREYIQHAPKQHLNSTVYLSLDTTQIEAMGTTQLKQHGYMLGVYLGSCPLHNKLHSSDTAGV